LGSDSQIVGGCSMASSGSTVVVMLGVFASRFMIFVDHDAFVLSYLLCVFLSFFCIDPFRVVVLFRS
jgi:hypothetical protein